MATTAATFNAPRHYDEDYAPFTFGPFAHALVERVPAHLPGKVLEIACGTGAVTRALRGKLAPGVPLVATDLSAAMLDYARSRSPDADITWQAADAMQLPFEAGAFAAVVCGFGFMFAPDRRQALTEAHRVLVQDGRLFFSVWDRIEDNPHGLAGARVIEALFPGDAQMKFRVPYEMHDEAQLHALLGQAGFADVRIERRRIPITGIDPRRLADGQIRGTPRSALLVERGVSLDAVVQQLAAELAAQGGDPYSGHGQALLVEARART